MRIVEFLRARLIDEKRRAEAAAATLTARHMRGEPLPPTEMPLAMAYSGGWYDPDRVLRDVEAKERIVTICDGAAWSETGRAVLAMDILKELAAVYSDHPDHAERWTP